MWYGIPKFIKNAGADNFLQGGLAVKGTLEETFSPYLWIYNIDQAPSASAILGFFQGDFLKILRKFDLDFAQAKLDKNERATARHIVEELKSAEFFVKKIIRLYRENPKYSHYVYPMYTEMGKIVQAIRKYDPNYSGYFYDPGTHSPDHSWWMADILKSGYGTILNLEKLGLRMPPQFKIMIMAGLDIKSNPVYANDSTRQLVQEYIEKTYPFYQRFKIENGDDNGWLKTIEDIKSPTDEFMAELDGSLLPFEKDQRDTYWNGPIPWMTDFLSNPMFKSGIPKNDLHRYMAEAAKPIQEQHTNNPVADALVNNIKAKNQGKILTTQVEAFSTSDTGNAIEQLLANSESINPEAFKTALKAAISKISYYDPSDSISVEQLQKLWANPVSQNLLKEEIKKLLESNWKETITTGSVSLEEDRIIKLGLVPKEILKAYVRRYPRAVKQIMPFKPEVHQELMELAQKTLQKEEKLAKLKEEKLEKERLKKEKQQTNNTVDNEDNEDMEVAEEFERTSIPRRYSPMQLSIDQGDIVSAPLSTIENGKYYQLALQVGQAMRLDPDIVREWADMVQVYIIKNDNFNQKLQEMKSFGYDTIKNFDFLGAFSESFSADEDPSNRMPAIFLNQNIIERQHDKIPLFHVLGINSNISNDAVMTHEIAHALNFIATGGRMLRSNLSDQSGDKGRDYLTSYPELIARIYGEMPIWKKAIHDKIVELRSSDLIRQAVVNEITESTLTHSASSALGAIDPVQEYNRANQGQFPYFYTENPVEAATKRVQRMEAKLADMIRADALRNRRAVLLDVIRQINQLKSQLLVLQKASEELDIDTSATDAEERKRINEELMKLERFKVEALNGGYDLEIDSSITSVVNSFLIRELKTMAETVNDPDWTPPSTWINKDGEDITPAFRPGSQPMNYYELRDLNDWSNDMLDNTSGGKKLDEPHQMESVLPTTTPGYEETFRNQVVPKYYQENTASYNHALKNKRDAMEKMTNRNQVK